MSQSTQFGQIVEAVDELSYDEQETLSALLERRLADFRREAIAEDIRQARSTYEQGDAQPVTADELMREIRS